MNEYRVINGTPVAKNFCNLFDYFSDVHTFVKVQKHNLQYCNEGSVLYNQYYNLIDNIDKSISALLRNIKNDLQSGQIEIPKNAKTNLRPYTGEDCKFFCECGTIGGSCANDEPCPEFEKDPFV